MEQEIKTALKPLIEKIKQSDKDKIHTEEEVKQSFVLPFLHALGYNVFDTNVIKPEYTADIGTKKGEKVDYAILSNGAPLVLIEVKHHKENLDNHNNQLVRYFQVCAGKYGCRFGILTNGIEYRFFSDIEKDNVMDKTPFLTINFEKPKDRDIAELQRFAKDSLNVDEIKKVAKTNLYRQQIQEIFKKEIENPSDDFVEFFARQIIGESRRVTQSVKDEFKEPIKKTLRNLINDLANDKITEIKNEIAQAQSQDSSEVVENEESGIVTTEEELQAFYIVKGIFAERGDIALEQISYKDTRSYFGVLFDNKVTKWICRFYLDGGKKYLVVSLESEKRININHIDEIYKYKKELNEALDRRMKNL
ncbi:type I restriction endonuclease [Helicobacter sp. 23-1046]